MPVITFMLRIQSWNSLCVCLNHGFGHTNKVSAWNFNRTCDFWITQIWREWFGELGNVNKTTSCYKRVAKEPKQHRNLSYNAMTCHLPRRLSHLTKYSINITKHRIWHEYPCVPQKRHVHRIPVEMKPPGSGFILLLDIPNKCVFVAYIWDAFRTPSRCVEINEGFVSPFGTSNFQYKSCSRYITRGTFWEIHSSTKNIFASSVKVVKHSSRSSATRSSMTQIQMLNELWSTELVICRWLLCSQSLWRDRFRKLTLYHMWCFVE